MLSDAGLIGMHGSHEWQLGVSQAWWARGTRGTDNRRGYDRLCPRAPRTWPTAQQR